MAHPDLSGYMLGDFLLIKPIAKGGHGTAYLAVQPLLKRNAVVKVAHSQQPDEETRQRFLREAQLASRLDHGFAARIHSFGTAPYGAIEDGILWIAMEWVQGVTLSEWLKQFGPMPPEQLVPFFERIAEVVYLAHELGIVHRDLKPSNIMVIERQGRMEPKLLDFGIAKLIRDLAVRSGDAPGPDDVETARIRVKPVPVERPPADPSDPSDPSDQMPWLRSEYRGLTAPGVPLGTLEYMPPEQWFEAQTVDRTADTYSLGIVLFEALTGRMPFYGRSSDEYYRLHRYGDVPSLRGRFSPEANQVIQRALSKYPRARYRDVREMASALRAALRVVNHEHLSATAQHWEDLGRPPGLLWGPEVLKSVTEPPKGFSKPECSFITRSQRHAQRKRWLWRSVIALLAVGAFVIAAMKIRLAHEQARMAQERARAAERLTEAVHTESEREQGRAALLNGAPEAQAHLTEAYKLDHLQSTAFMLARAIQHRLAELARFASTSGRTWSAAFSPDGKQLVTTDDKNAQVWDAQTYRLLFTLPHGDTVYQAVYSSDSTRIVTAGGDGAVRIWNATSGALVRELRHDSTSRYYTVALSPDGKFVAAIGLMQPVTHVWDAGTGTLLAELREDASTLPSLAFSSDSRWLATTGENDARVFDTRTWVQVCVIPGPAIHGLSWDPSGPRLLTGSVEGNASIWAIPSGERIHHLREFGEPIDAVAFSANGRFVVTASRDGTEQVWDATSGSFRSQGNYLHAKILSVEFDRTSTLVLAAGASGSVAVAGTALEVPVTVLDGPRNIVRVAHFDPSGRRVIGASWDGTARIWDATAPFLRWNSPPVNDDCGVVTSLEPDQRFVAVGCIDHPTYIWDTARGQLLAELPSVTQVDGDFASAYPAVSAAGDRAAIARGHTVEVYELPGGRLLRTIAHRAAVNAVAFATTGHDLVSGDVDGSLLVTRDGAEPLALPMFPSGVDAAGFLPDGRVVAGAGMRLRVYDPSRGVVLADLEMSARVRTLRMSLDSRRLITVPSFMGRAEPPELWDLEHYRPLAQLEGQGQAYSARFVAGDQILTACGDGAARLWDGTGQLLQTYRGGSRFLVDVTLSPDGSMIVGGGGDGLLRFWDAASGRQLWTMPAHRSHLIGVRIEGDDIITRGFSGDISRWTFPKPERVFEACGGPERCAIVSR